ncbi:MAG: alpha-1,2-fucosyltransferase, partial [Lachnospiraceae bacterium]|nr:alpha-1,2-fucosyltransferase [Lachnospiraceae bacterium]
MVVIEAAGGLGNQLQQYAFYRKVLSLGADARLDLTWFSPEVQESAEYRRELELTRLAGIDFVSCTKEERASFPLEGGLAGKMKRSWQKAKAVLSGSAGSVFTEEKIYHPELISRIEKDPDTDLYVRGFFACEYYYADLLPVLREEIGFPLSDDPLLTEDTKENIRSFAETIRSCEAVSVHVRRGDYLDE